MFVFKRKPAGRTLTPPEVLSLLEGKSAEVGQLLVSASEEAARLGALSQSVESKVKKLLDWVNLLDRLDSRLEGLLQTVNGLEGRVERVAGVDTHIAELTNALSQTSREIEQLQSVARDLDTKFVALQREREVADSARTRIQELNAFF